MSNCQRHLIHLWVERTDRFQDVSKMFSVLNQEERERADQFKRSNDRIDYITAHALKRIRIAEHLNNTDPNKLCFSTAESGKPYLLGKDLQFNLSHSRGYVALAISTSCECAVDIETYRELLKLDVLMKKTMSSLEVLKIKKASMPNKDFFDNWVLKEAFVKNSGIGLKEPFFELCTVNELVREDINVGILRNLTMFWKQGDDYSLAASCGGQGDASFVLENRSYGYSLN